MKNTISKHHPSPGGGKPNMVRRLATLTLTAAGALMLVIAASDTSEAAKRCRSEAYEKQDAVDYCEDNVLHCADKEPPQVTKCRGRARRWICQCKPASSARRRRPRLRFEFDFGLGRGHDYDPYYDDYPRAPRGRRRLFD